MTPSEAYAGLADAYFAGDPADIMAAEYAYLLALLAPVTEWQARQPAPDGDSILHLIAALLPDLLPEGAAPTLRDSLHALDIAFAEWQAEESAWQRWQARQLVALSARIEARLPREG